MPKKSGKNPMAEKYGKRLLKAHKEHKDQETDYGSFSDLPPGIKSGVARLVDCRIGTYEKGDNEGESFFYAAGVVLSPREHDGVRIEGARTSIMEPLCDTEGRSRETFEEHLGWIYNELRKLGADTSDIEAEDYEGLMQELGEHMEALKGDADDPETWTYFRFRTWQGKATPEFPDPRVNHNWLGTCEWEQEEDEDELDDETPPPPKNGKKTQKTEAPAPPSKKGAKPAPPSKPDKKTKAPPEDAEDEEGEVFEEFDDLGSLAKKADRGDEKAGKELKALAVKLGIAGKKIDNAKNWAIVVGWINDIRNVDTDAEEEEVETGEDEEVEDAEVEADEEPADEETEEEEDFDPMKEDVYKYRPLDAKTKKPAKKPIECEVTAVDKKKRMVNLKSIEDPEKVYKAVPWNDLIRPTDEE